MKYSSYLNDEPMPDAASEKEQVGTSAESLPFFLHLWSVAERSFGEVKTDVSCLLRFYFQGNEYFKQKKFTEAIEYYSRSIGLSPTAVAFANRAMAYLKLRR